MKEGQITIAPDLGVYGPRFDSSRSDSFFVATHPAPTLFVPRLIPLRLILLFVSFAPDRLPPISDSSRGISCTSTHHPPTFFPPTYPDAKFPRLIPLRLIPLQRFPPRLIPTLGVKLVVFFVLKKWVPTHSAHYLFTVTRQDMASTSCRVPLHRTFLNST